MAASVLGKSIYKGTGNEVVVYYRNKEDVKWRAISQYDNKTNTYQK